MNHRHTHMSHGHTRTHKFHDDPDLGEATTFPLIVLFVPSHGACTQMSFCPKTPKLGMLKFLKLIFLRFWRPIIFFVNLWLIWGLKQSCISHQELFNSMWHITCTQKNQGDFWLLVVGSQIVDLIPNLYFGHNLCFKYPNGSYEPILDIYVSRAFQWYNKLYNSMNFNFWNRSLKIRESIEIPIPKVGTHLGMCEFFPSHSPTFWRTWNATPKLHFQPTPL
jgi:hypothetical protein